MWYTLSTKEVEEQMQTNIEFGLNEKQVEDKQNKFGLNKLEEKKRESIVIKFIKQFNDFMIIILIIASIISAVVARLEGSNCSIQCYYGTSTRSKSRKIIRGT